MPETTQPARPLKGKLAMVTGATRGLGLETAMALAEQGAHIIAVGRTVGALEELDDNIRAIGGEATLVPIDLMDEERVDVLGPSLYPRYDHLDILIGNAGYLGGLSPLTHVKTTEWTKTLSTNLTANFLLLRSLHPLLLRADKALALFIGCTESPGETSAYWGPYNASKAALKAMVECYQQETAETNIEVAFHTPPAMDTALRRKAFPGGDVNALTPVEAAANEIKDLVLKSIG
ncbi:MAG: short-chain dehydrogenase [Rhodomicrobium sp.]|nr:MAG: short-chain dehydrogenase [Rhodomicrobium sp.]